MIFQYPSIHREDGKQVRYACLAVTMVFTLLALAACGTQAPTPVPTSTDAPISAAAEATAAPSPTLPPSPTPTEEPTVPLPTSTLAPTSTPLSRDQARTLGQIRILGDRECPGDSGARRLQLTVRCPEIADARVTVRVTGAGPSGTVILTTGVTGNSWYRARGESVEGRDYTTGMMDALLADGFWLAELNWTKLGIWEGPGSTISLACRSATAIQWVHDNVHQGGLFVAQGNSGGAAQIAFSLAYYGLDRVLDLVNIGSLVPCPISTLGKLNSKYQEDCLEGGSLWNEATGPMLYGNPRLHYPTTTVASFSGIEETKGEIQESVRRYHDAITSEKSLLVVLNTGHEVHRTQEGTESMLASIRAARE